MIIAMTRIRNESEIIKDTLNHIKEFADVVIIYDDKSTDNTVEICTNWATDNKFSMIMIQGEFWIENREYAESDHRQILLNNAKLISKNINDWCVYLDADERIDLDWKTFDDLSIEAMRMKLFDFYITEEDKDLNYNERKYIGQEFRQIMFAYRIRTAVGFTYLDQRECTLSPDTKIADIGFVKHYGKSVSIQQWEDTCEYYATHFPKYADKWNARRGKAIHTESDFGAKLITWDQKEELGFLLRH